MSLSDERYVGETTRITRPVASLISTALNRLQYVGETNSLSQPEASLISAVLDQLRYVGETNSRFYVFLRSNWKVVS